MADIVLDMTSDESRDSKREKNQPDMIIERIIIQCDLQDEEHNLSSFEEKFKGTGVNLDKNYGPYLIDPKLHRYVVRGFVDKEAKEKISKIKGVRVFTDLKIQPLKKD